MKKLRKAKVFFNNALAGILEEMGNNIFRFSYQIDYQGQPISLTMPIKNKLYLFDKFPPFFDGFLPEGISLDVVLCKYKLDKKDYFGLLMQVGHNNVGAVTVEELK